MFGLVMVLTQRLNPQPPNMDPTQAQLMKAMPMMFSVMFFVFPAGLCLYSVVNSGVSLLQQKMIYRSLGDNT
jgi:YidC/Oxa1 family membrane protein insertase